MRLVIVLLALVVAASAKAAEPIAGRWVTNDGKSIVKREPGGLKAEGCILFFCRAQHWKPAR